MRVCSGAGCIPYFEIQYRKEFHPAAPNWTTMRTYDMESEMREDYPYLRKMMMKQCIELRMVRVEPLYMPTIDLTDGMAGGRLKIEPIGEGGTDLIETLEDDADQGISLPVTEEDWGDS